VNKPPGASAGQPSPSTGRRQQHRRRAKILGNYPVSDSFVSAKVLPGAERPSCGQSMLVQHRAVVCRGVRNGTRLFRRVRRLDGLHGLIHVHWPPVQRGPAESQRAGRYREKN